MEDSVKEPCEFETAKEKEESEESEIELKCAPESMEHRDTRLAFRMEMMASQEASC